MSLRFNFVICCDLREDTPLEVIDAIRFLSDPAFVLEQKLPLVFSYIGGDGSFQQQNLWDLFGEDRFLIPDFENETISSFQRKWRTAIPLEGNRDVYCWSLQYSGRYIHDDFAAHCHTNFIYWLATYVDGLVGYWHETNSFGKMHIVYGINGEYKDHSIFLP